MHSLLISGAALKELQDAFNCYETQMPNLGFVLMEETERCFSLIKMNPKFYFSISEKERRIHLKKYPYKIIYFIEENTVIVTSFFHASRKPR